MLQSSVRIRELSPTCERLFRPIRASDVDRSILTRAGHSDPPGIAAHLAILDKAASHVFLDEDFDVLAAVRAGHEKFVRHHHDRNTGPRSGLRNVRDSEAVGAITIALTANSTVRGRFVWHELMTTDTKSAAAFYTKVAGWKTQVWNQHPSYTMFTAKGRPMAGLMAQP